MRNRTGIAGTGQLMGRRNLSLAYDQGTLACGLFYASGASSTRRHAALTSLESAGTCSVRHKTGHAAALGLPLRERNPGLKAPSDINCRLGSKRPIEFGPPIMF